MRNGQIERTLKRVLTLSFSAALAWCIPVVASAQQARPASPSAPASVSANEQSVRDAIEAYRKAVDLGDTEAIAEFWSPEADYVDYKGRALKIHTPTIRERTQSREDGHIARQAPKTETLAVRFITPDVAVEDGTIERSDAPGDHPKLGRYCAMWVKKDGRWLIDGVRESLYRAAAGANKFQDLDWMIGDWVAEGPQGTIQVSCTWGPEKAYILRHLKVEPKGEEPALSATQWIGWDPVHERIHSFVYDSRGGYGQGIWSKDGDAWTVSTSGVLPDGQRTSATNFYSRVDDNTAIWESVDDQIEGRPGPDVRFRATRKPAKK
ncbi:MAG TPA: nuclear transport factor 2 family protein [Pirellulales bacterium]|jgi:uncharacterized protein (TIGR02246 family)